MISLRFVAFAYLIWVFLFTFLAFICRQIIGKKRFSDSKLFMDIQLRLPIYSARPARIHPPIGRGLNDSSRSASGLPGWSVRPLLSRLQCAQLCCQRIVIATRVCVVLQFSDVYPCFVELIEKQQALVLLARQLSGYT